MTIKQNVFFVCGILVQQYIDTKVVPILAIRKVMISTALYYLNTNSHGVFDSHRFKKDVCSTLVKEFGFEIDYGTKE